MDTMQRPSRQAACTLIWSIAEFDLDQEVLIEAHRQERGTRQSFGVTCYFVEIEVAHGADEGCGAVEEWKELFSGLL